MESVVNDRRYQEVKLCIRRLELPNGIRVVETFQAEDWLSAEQ
jgi:hypothetical protein